MAICSVHTVSWRDKMTESKSRTKFVELAEKRVSRAIKDIRLVGNLSNKSNYSYTDQDIKKIVRVLRSEIDVLKSRFESSTTENETVFKL